VRFQLTHKLTTYLLVLAAMGTLASANLLSPTTVLLTIGFAALSWFVDPGTRLAIWMEWAAPVARLCAVAFFAICAYEVWLRLPEPDLTPVLNLVLFLVVYKLFGRQANRDYLQIYVLAFLMVLAGAAFAQTFLFAVCFTSYVVLTTWTLILLHLRREMEENYLVKHSGHAPSHKVGVARILNSRRVVGGSFLVVTGAVALAICLGAVVTFAFVPRVGAGFALGGARARQKLIGFSDEVTLGTAGFLSADDQTVALRAVLPRLARLGSDREREIEIDHFYWRGTVYDTYRQGRWLRSHREALRSQLQDTGGPVLVHEPHIRPKAEAFPPLANTEQQEIDIVGVSAPVAFALDHPVAFEIPPPRFGMVPELRLVPRWSGEVAFAPNLPAFSAFSVPSSLPDSPSLPVRHRFTDGSTTDVPDDLHTFSGAHYIAYSRDPFTIASLVNGRPLSEIPAEIMAPYLALSPTLSPRVRDLGRVITAGKPTAAAKAVAVMDWLDRTHEYSLNLGRTAGTVDPVEQFLFDRKTGHCEYFASAAAVLLRTAGVPTRYVNGFLGGEWNAVGKYVTVRQNRAHAWVEAYLGERGWMRVDATPPVRPPGRMGKLKQVLDSVEFFWSRWVVGYDLGRQLDLARDLGRGVGVETAAPGAAGGTSLPWKRFAAGAAVVAAIIVAWIGLRRRRLRYAPGAVLAGLGHQAVGRLYRRCLERLSERGYPRRPSETPREFGARIIAARLEGAEAFGRLTDLYLQARFGRKEIRDATVAELSQPLISLGQPPRDAALSHAA
jgi:transglutaminase-like putative cysteine protease